MTTTSLPSLTIAMSTGYEAKAAEMALQAFAAQTIANEIEVLFAVNPGVSVETVTPLLERFHSYRVFDSAPIDTVDKSTARMALEANAEYVAMMEDHAFPDPEWAELLLKTYRETGANAVGSGVINANGVSYLSWANFFLAYSGWTINAPEGRTNWISHHNGSFRKTALEALPAEDVVNGCNRESKLVRELRDAGNHFEFQPKARVRHLNPSNLRSTFTHRFDVGQLYATLRRQEESWGLPKRLAYAVLAPAIPVLRYARERERIFAANPEVREVTHGPALFVGLVFDAIGQMTGYIFGEGRSRARMARFEMDRAKHLTARDKADFYVTA